MLGSGSWGDAGWTQEPSLDSHSNNSLSLCQFLYAVRSLVRTSYAACLITVPAHLFQVPTDVLPTRDLYKVVINMCRIHKNYGVDKMLRCETTASHLFIY